MLHNCMLLFFLNTKHFFINTPTIYVTVLDSDDLKDAWEFHYLTKTPKLTIKSSSNSQKLNITEKYILPKKWRQSFTTGATCLHHKNVSTPLQTLQCSQCSSQWAKIHFNIFGKYSHINQKCWLMIGHTHIHHTYTSVIIMHRTNSSKPCFKKYWKCMLDRHS